MLKLDVNKAYLDPDRYQTVGIIGILMSGVDDWHGDLKTLINEEVLPAYRHGKIRFFYQYDQIPVGFVTWAHLSPETEARIIGTLDPWLHISEWNEGKSFWLKYMYLPRALRSEGWQLCLNELFVTEQSARVLLERRGHKQALELDRAVLERMARHG